MIHTIAAVCLVAVIAIVIAVLALCLASGRQPDNDGWQPPAPATAQAIQDAPDPVAETVAGMHQAYIDSEFAAIWALPAADPDFDRHAREACDLTQDPKDQT